jgi:tetratricopeptide (TPR) repeat protein
MRRLLVPLLALSWLGLASASEEPPVVAVHRWIDAVRAHRPGVVDQPIRGVATAPPERFDVVLKNLQSVFEHEFSTEPQIRNDILRRGALLHTDIALLLPEQAAAFAQFSGGTVGTPPFGSLQPLRPRVRREGDALALSLDGEYLESAKETAHWSFASALLRGITPHAPSDEFVRLWYRAIAASFQNSYRLGSGTYHMERALEVMPRDPILLFYAGAMHEALASPRFQNIPVTAGALAHDLNFPTEHDQLRTAEGLLRDAVRAGAPPEARVRLGRVLGRLGSHAEAAAMLTQANPPADDARLGYFRELFLGTEQGALGKIDLARESLERAAHLFPTAQAPLIAMSDLFRRSGDRTAALHALQRLEALPDASGRVDPWWDYHHSYALDAGDQLAAVRAWVDRHQP